jgi:hypothetical protein
VALQRPPQRTLVPPIRRVDVDLGVCRGGYLSGDFIEDDGDEFVGEFFVGGLEDRVRAIEDDEGVACYVCLIATVRTTF